VTPAKDSTSTLSRIAEDDLVACIRAICALELKTDPNYPFFKSNYRDNETADQAILRLFLAERRYHLNDFEAVLVMCRG
jgi:hypothetical protein